MAELGFKPRPVWPQSSFLSSVQKLGGKGQSLVWEHDSHLLSSSRDSKQQGHSKKVYSRRINLRKASRLGLWLRFGREARWGSGTASRLQEQAEVHLDHHGWGLEGHPDIWVETFGSGLFFKLTVPVGQKMG